MSDTLLMLLEMIEEVLEEQSGGNSPVKIAERVHATLNAMGDTAKPPEPIKDKNNQFRIELENAFDREPIVNKLQKLMEQERNNLGQGFSLQKYYSGKTRLIGHTIKQGRKIFFRYVLKGKGGINESEEMEKIIANATITDPKRHATIKAGFDPKGQKLNTMRNSIQNLGLPELRKQDSTDEPSDIYIKFGAISPVPKTDLSDGTNENKFSVKKGGGAQFVSAQGPESAALWYIALKNSAPDLTEQMVDNALKEIPDLIKKQFSYDNFKVLKESDLTQKEKSDIYAQFGEILFQNILKSINISPNVFLEAFATEGMSGNKKFGEESLSSANKVLTWAPSLQKVTIATIKNYIKANKNKIRLRVSDRGGQRGGAIRGDILANPVQKESINEEAVKNLGKRLATTAALAGALAGGVGSSPTKGDAASPDPQTVSALEQPPDQSASEPQEVKTEQQYEAFVEKLANEYASLIKYAFKVRFKENTLLFLDYLRPYEEDKIDMIPFYNAVKNLPVDFGDAAEPNV